MLLLVDECLPEALVVQLRARGHDVIWARETYSGWDDASILATATQAGRIVISEDRDFGTLTIRHSQPAEGVVIAHFDKYTGTLSEITCRIAEKIDDLGESCMGQLTTIEPGRVRQRALRGGS